MKTHPTRSKKGSRADVIGEADIRQLVRLLPGSDPNGKHTFRVDLRMSLHALWVFARAAKHRGVSIGELLGTILDERDIELEEREFRTKLEWEAHCSERERDPGWIKRKRELLEELCASQPANRLAN